MRFTLRYFVAGLAICLCVSFVLLQLIGSPQFDTPADSQQLKKQIVQLSKQYVDSLAAQQKTFAVQDGPYAVVNTHFDLKKTLAVLLQSYNDRIERLESKVLTADDLRDDESPARSRSIEPVNVDEAQMQLKKVIVGSQDGCELPDNWATSYPECENKIGWMGSFWQTDPCYAANGVDGSRCSFIIYLGEIESHCPVLGFRQSRYAVKNETEPVLQRATPQHDVEGLFALMNDVPQNYEWIKNRIRQMWPKWLAAFKFLMQKQAWTFEDRQKKRILLHMGFLSSDTGLKFSENSVKGGPLGELVQWSDLIAVSYLLGHQLIISSDTATFVGLVKADPALKSSCPLPRGQKAKQIDLLFIDIMGLRQMRRKVPGGIDHYRCRLRVLDSFGTQAEFNDPLYYTQHKAKLGGHKNYWGGHKLQLQQYYTLFPHSADNTFLGFVVDMHNLADTTSTANVSQRQNVALVYGKQAYMWQNHSSYLDLIHSLLPVHATVDTTDDKYRSAVPDYVVNHGVMGGAKFHELLRQVKVFIGLGFPYEGPAPLEAIANGAIFINPRYATPKSRLSEPFFKEKPTLRSLSSQSPYAEQFIGPPHVLTVDVHDIKQVTDAIKTALNTESKPLLPFELTPPGMLERVNALLEHQDLCTPAANWPPFSAATLMNTTKDGQSCQERCADSNQYCERSYFAKINSNETIKRFSRCSSIDSADEPYAPAFQVPSEDKTTDSGICRLQHNDLLYSCATPAPVGWTRLCACRDAIREQVQLCAACL